MSPGIYFGPFEWT